MWQRISGVVQAGHQVASGLGRNNPYLSGTLQLQLPFFKALGLDLSGCYLGTLNVSIAPLTFQLTQPHYTFRKVAWTPLHPPEDFSFSACRVIFREQSYSGWVYYPHPETKIRHFQDPSLIEILAPFIDGIEYGARVELELNSAEVVISG